MKPVTVVLPTYCPTYEVEQHLKKCLSSFENNTSRDLYELIIVEQGAPYCAPELGYNPELPCDLYVHSWEPLGFARAVNIGFRLARTEYVCVLSNDVVVPPHWLELMLDDFTRSSDCGILAPMEGPQATTDPSGNIAEHDEHWGALYLMRRTVLEQVGLLDEEKLNQRFCDQDLSIRVKQAGWRVCRTSSVTVQHANSATYSKMNKQAEESEERAEMIRRHGYAEFADWLANR